MGLADNVHATAVDMIDSLGYASSMTSEAKSASYTAMEAYLNKLFTHIKTNAVIDMNKTPGIAPGTFVLETLIAPGTGTNGSALVVAPGAISGTIKAPAGKVT